MKWHVITSRSVIKRYVCLRDDRETHFIVFTAELAPAEPMSLLQRHVIRSRGHTDFLPSKSLYLNNSIELASCLVQVARVESMPLYLVQVVEASKTISRMPRPPDQSHMCLYLLFHKTKKQQQKGYNIFENSITIYKGIKIWWQTDWNSQDEACF